MNVLAHEQQKRVRVAIRLAVHAIVATTKQLTDTLGHLQFAADLRSNNHRSEHERNPVKTAHYCDVPRRYHVTCGVINLTVTRYARIAPAPDGSRPIGPMAQLWIRTDPFDKREIKAHIVRRKC